MIIGEVHVLPVIACGTNSKLSCSARSGLGHLSRSLFVPLPTLSLSLYLSCSVANQSMVLNDSQGYKERACRGLFRDRGNFRDARRIVIAREPLGEVGGRLIGRHDLELMRATGI